MKNNILSGLLWVIAIFIFIPASASLDLDQGELESTASLTVDRGVGYLLERQDEHGAWAGEPAITALAMQALYKSDPRLERKEIREAINKGREFILQRVQPNGAFAGVFQPYLNYTTSVCLAALNMLNRPEDEEVMRNARHFLMNLQLGEEHDEHPTESNSPFYGGIGYGSGGPMVPDLSNTQFALEALYLTEHIDRDTEFAEQARATWARADKYLQSVQRIPADAAQDWQPETENAEGYDGGFIYRPDQCRVREKLAHEFEGEPISYGAATMGGMKSLLYAGIDKDDIRVQAAVEWIKQNYTLDENPVIGAEAHYYYLWTFAKAMQAYGQETLRTADGEERHWRQELLRQLIKLQHSQGNWINEKSGRYMESIPELTTAYALIAMQVALLPD